MYSVFQKDRKEELSCEYVESIFKSFGAFHPVVNPAVLANTGESEYFKDEVKCFFCNVLSNCDMYVPTRRTNRFFFICKPCIQDFNMFVFNKDKLEYCRMIKLPRTPLLKG